MKTLLLPALLLSLASELALASPGANIGVYVVAPANELFVTDPVAASGQQSATGNDGSTVVASAHASLSTGSLGILASNFPASGIVAWSDAQWTDNLTFNSAQPGQTLTVGVSLTVHGTLGIGAQPSFSFVLSASPQGDTLAAGATWFAPSNATFTTDTATFQPSKTATGSANWNVFGPSTFIGTVNVVSGYTGIIAMGLQGQGPLDFSNTAAIQLSLPAGVTLQSASGVFLTTPVPEAPSALLLALGMAAFWVRARLARPAEA